MMKKNEKIIVGIVMHKSDSDFGYLQSINDEYRKSIIEAGAIPLGLLSTQNILIDDTKPSKMPRMTKQELENLFSILELCDGIILTGGNKWYEYDERICHYAFQHKIPILGICMGMQIMNAVDTRTSLTDYSKPIENESNLNHSLRGEKYAHKINIIPNTELFKIINKEDIMVNSNHNYHIDKLNNFVISAKSEDGYIEAIELSNHPFAVGVQWHPEKMIEYDGNAKALFKEFIRSCRSKKKSRIS